MILISNDFYSLKLLVMLTEQYCLKYRVKLEPKKTKLIGYCSKGSELLVKLAASSFLLIVNIVMINFTHEAEHVGVLRNTDGNLQNILKGLRSTRNHLEQSSLQDLLEVTVVFLLLHFGFTNFIAHQFYSLV